VDDVECFRILGVDIDKESGMKGDIYHKVSEGEKVSGVVIWEEEGMC
jgi:hypothetical protein